MKPKIASIAKILARQCCVGRVSVPATRPAVHTKMLTQVSSAGVKRLSSHLATKEASPETLLLSDSCVARLNAITEEGGHLRIMVEGGGCSGFQYKFDLEEGVELEEDDVLIEREGAKQKSIPQNGKRLCSKK